MFKSTEVADGYKTLIGWRQHHDTDEIELTAPLLVTDSGEYYQQKHPALRLDIIQALLPENQELEEYLMEKVRDGAIEMINDIIQYRQVSQYGKTLLEQRQLLNKYGWVNDKIVNENRFVGLQIRTKSVTGLQTVINQIGLQFSDPETFTLYVFHSSKRDPIAQLPKTTTGAAGWDWTNAEVELNAFSRTNQNEGVWIVGYYQEDILGSAINATDFNWDRGVCGGCNHSAHKVWNEIQQYFSVYPLYVPQDVYTKGEMFDLNDAFYVNDQSWGLNLRLSVRCDLTDFLLDHKFAFKNLLAYKVTSLILNDMKYSQQINYIEENIKMMIIRDLEGDTETKMANITMKYQKELKAVNFNIGGINQSCLPCEGEAYEPSYSAI